MVPAPWTSSRILGAASGFAASLTPGLYPRHWLIQGALSGAGLALGAGAGAAIARLVRRLRARALLRQQGSHTGLASAVAIGVTLAALVWHTRWTLEVRGLMGLEQPLLPYLPLLLVAALATSGLLLLGVRAVRSAHRAYVRVVGRTVTPRWRRPVRVLVLALVLLPLVNGAALAWVTGALDAALVAGDARVDPAVPQPASAYRAGGPSSLIRWETLSAPGRAFVAQGPTVAELETFSGESATPPIRVYAGMSSAGSDRERAQLAVAELERTGAFERSVLVVVTPTGSGSINPYAIDPLEFLYNGDTAAVAMQYGHFPSWVTMTGNQERAKQGATALFDAVSARVRTQPESARPQLLVYGESLGSFGSEANFKDLTEARARTDGMLLVGPTRGNRLWRELTAQRDAGTPIWHPVYGGGEQVRFGWDDASLRHPDSRWPFPRVAYLQHATDPITWLSPPIVVERPAWLDPPRGPDIARTMPYIPVLTAWQLTVDMALAETAPLGHGHMYGPEHAEAWALIAPPVGWPPERTAELRAVLDGGSSLTGSE